MRRSTPQSPTESAMSDVLAKIAEERGIDSIPAIGLAYLFAKYPLVFPVVGMETEKVRCRTLHIAQPG